jgi:hypothetical protein
MQSIEKRIQKLETAEAPRLAGAELLAAKWAALAREHPCIKVRADARVLNCKSLEGEPHAKH